MLLPPECLRIDLRIHTDPERLRACLDLEVADAHTRELLAKRLDPNAHALTLGALEFAVHDLIHEVLTDLWHHDG